jgi:2-(1,2-epoxy-1,2-dihydrophenyl)acetyl-CoA isomerase
VAFAVADSGVYFEHATNKTLTGFLDTGYIRYATIEKKYFKLVKPRFNTPMFGTCVISTKEVDGDVNSIITIANGTPALNTDLATNIATPQEELAFRFTFGRDATDATKGPVDIGHTIETEWNPLIDAIKGSETLVIGAIQGVCAGAGLSVALATDLKIAAPGVRFISGFSQIGLAPDAGMSFMLVRQMGNTKALEFALLGKPLLSEQMVEYNFINQIAEAPLEEAVKLAGEINNLPPLAVKMIKKNFQFAAEKELGEVLNREKYVQRFLGFSEDYKEGVAAFLGKRKPIFKGQ